MPADLICAFAVRRPESRKFLRLPQFLLSTRNKVDPNSTHGHREYIHTDQAMPIFRTAGAIPNEAWLGCDLVERVGDGT